MFKCQFSDCEKLYSTKYNLQRHWELKHLETKRFRCLVCGKCLSSKQNLSEHSYTHSLAKPYLCKELMCGMAFRQNSQLSNHKKLHKELKKILNNSGEFKELKLTNLRVQEFDVEASTKKENSESKTILPPITRPLGMAPLFAWLIKAYRKFKYDSLIIAIV